MKGKSTHLVDVPSNSNHSELDYFNEHVDPVYAHAHMVSVEEINHKKHLIQFPNGVDFKKVRTSEEKCPTVLLKADTGADVNLMNLNTFDNLFHDRTVLELTTLRMEAYENNTAVTVLRKFQSFLRWKGHVYRLLFYVTNVNSSPNLLSQNGCIEALLFCGNYNFQQIPRKYPSDTHTAYNPLGPVTNEWQFISTFTKCRNLCGETFSFHQAVTH